jgi:hypothetical protein
MSSFLGAASEELRDGSASSDAKRQKTEASGTKADASAAVPSFRAWSKKTDTTNDEESTSTIFTLKCIYGDPSQSLPSHVRTAKVSVLKDMLKYRGLPIDGSKAMLLDRLQVNLPHIIIEIDSRECLQRIVNAMLFHFKWDTYHLFQCQLPARGSIVEGTENLWLQAFGDDFGLNVQDGRIDSNPNNHPKRIRNHIQKKLDAAGMDWSDIDRAKREPNAMGKWRKLMGSGFDPSTTGYDFDEFAAGGQFSLEELVIQKGDKIKLLYDLGDRNDFSIFVEEVKVDQALLPEVSLNRHDTRVKLVEMSECKIPGQHSCPGIFSS